ncbi:hypothetical protein [Helicobacter felis]|uniref:hypothetical protein n=1 Tax=Helicobacter felis TaxID=214 RepID=UPI000CEDBD76|nr:hypothetical protein [Helicobacter felis]
MQFLFYCSNFLDIVTNTTPITPILTLLKLKNMVWGVLTPYAAKLIICTMENLVAVLSSNIARGKQIVRPKTTVPK